LAEGDEDGFLAGGAGVLQVLLSCDDLLLALGFFFAKGGELFQDVPATAITEPEAVPAMEAKPAYYIGSPPAPPVPAPAPAPLPAAA
jgi:hypothetical protein